MSGLTGAALVGGLCFASTYENHGTMCRDVNMTVSDVPKIIQIREEEKFPKTFKLSEKQNTIKPGRGNSSSCC